jgi:Sec-independent protein translocase protein TatA
MTGSEHMSLGEAIKTSKPNMSDDEAKDEARKAERQAKVTASAKATASAAAKAQDSDKQ